MSAYLGMKLRNGSTDNDRICLTTFASKTKVVLNPRRRE